VTRIFDIHPLKTTEINTVICDRKGISLATAEAEKYKFYYLEDAQVPIEWYFTSTTIAGQGELMQNIVTDLIHKHANLTNIRVIWIPGTSIPGSMTLPRDIYEVVDSIEKCKETAIKYNVKIEISLATSWIPMGPAYYDEALRIVSNNRALQVVGYWWLRCRVTDLTLCTTHEVRGNDIDDTMGIEGFEEYKFIPSIYVQDNTGGGMEINDQAGRHIRQILRMVFHRYELEPRWESATTKTTRFYHIPEPRAPYKGRLRRLPAPSPGKRPTHTIVQERAEIRQAYRAGKSYRRDLPPTGLENYQWELLMAKSTKSDFKQLELVPLSTAPLSLTNTILTTEVSLHTRLVKPVCDDNAQQPTIYAKESTPGKEEEKGEPTKVNHQEADKAKSTVDKVVDKQGKEKNNPDATDEDDIRHKISAEISKMFEERQAKKRDKVKKLVKSKKKTSKK